MSQPAAIVIGTSFSLGSAILSPAIVVESVITSPLKPNSSLSKLVTISFDTVAGNISSSLIVGLYFLVNAGSIICPTITLLTPLSIQALYTLP